MLPFRGTTVYLKYPNDFNLRMPDGYTYLPVNGLYLEKINDKSFTIDSTYQKVLLHDKLT